MVLTFEQFDRLVHDSKAFESEPAARSYSYRTGGIMYTQVDGDHGERVYMRRPDRHYNQTGRYEVVTSWGGKTKFAAKGFHGVIRKPTRFVIGEGRYPERVDITPIKKHVDHAHHNLGKIPKINIKVPRIF